MMRRRRPIMRGAMVGGVGYMAGKAGARRAARESEQEQRIEGLESERAGAAPTGAAPAGAAGAGPAVAPAAEPSKLEQLRQLGELRDSGVLTPEEFEREKQQLLGGG